MRHARLKKMRDLRTIHLSARRPALFDLFETLHYYGQRLTWFGIEEHTKRYNQALFWIRHKTGLDYDLHNLRNAPANYRRTRNRRYRSKSKHVLSYAVKTGDWDDFNLPRFRKDMNWWWW